MTVSSLTRRHVKAAQDLGAHRVVLRAPAFEPEPLRRGMEKIANGIIAKV